MMNKILLITNTGKQEAVAFSEEFRHLLNTRQDFSLTEDPKEADWILTLGGDGTIIRAARDYASFGLPILGVNMGTVGYLAELNKEGLEQALCHLKKGEFFTEERMMLSGRVLRENRVVYENEALNDVVLHAKGKSNCLSFSLSVHEQPLMNYIADGLIVSTPTGSTAYNLSAGGPIVMPQGEMMVATPVCPHTLVNRTLVFPGEVHLTVHLSGREQECRLNFDGDSFEELCPGDRIEISKASKKVKLIQFEQNSFVAVLRNKLKG